MGRMAKQIGSGVALRGSPATGRKSLVMSCKAGVAGCGSQVASQDSPSANHERQAADKRQKKSRLWPVEYEVIMQARKKDSERERDGYI